MPVQISYSSKVWRVAYSGHIQAQGYSPFTTTSARFAEHSRAGWTSSLGFPYIDAQTQQDYYDSNGNAVSSCSYGGQPTATCCFIDTLLIHMPDGSSHELRSSDQPLCYPNFTLPDNLYATDGSRLRYQRSTQTLFLPDGSRYVLVSGASKYIDRNGNTLSYNSALNQWTDTLGRSISVPLAAGTAVGDFTYPVTVAGGASVNYIFRWKNLSNALTPDLGTGQPPTLMTITVISPQKQMPEALPAVISMTH